MLIEFERVAGSGALEPVFINPEHVQVVCQSAATTPKKGPTTYVECVGTLDGELVVGECRDVAKIIDAAQRGQNPGPIA